VTEQDILDFADRFVGAIQAGDVAGMRACYAPDARIWHNNDGLEQTLDENVKVLKWFIRVLPDRRYRVVRREALKDGFLQQHVLEATLPDGQPWAMAACVVVKMENGLITRLEEYIDSAALAPLSQLGRRA
jgi:ketosteroid isomerase-like protein